MEYFVLFKDYGEDYGFREFDKLTSLLTCVTDLKNSGYEEVRVIKGKEVKIKTIYSLEDK